MTPEQQSRYRDGYDAANRQGKYASATEPPRNPHAVGTTAFADWFEGFADATRTQLGRQEELC